MATQPETPLDLTNEPLIIRRTSKKKYNLFKASASVDSKSNGNHEEEMSAKDKLNDSVDNHEPPQQEPSDINKQAIKQERDDEKQQTSTEEPEKVIENNVKTIDETAINKDEKIGKKGRKRKSEVAQLVENEAASPNPLQRTRHGLRPLPQQVDYYQSVLEERKAKSVKDKKTSEPEPEEPTVDDEVIPVKTRRSSVQTRNKSSKDDKTDDILSKEHFSIGDIVWGTLPTFRTWFPALLVSHLHCGQKPPKSGHVWVYWFGDHQVSEIPRSKIKSFLPHFDELSKGTSSLTSPRMKEALQVLSSRAGLTFAVDMSSDDDPMAEWARNGFKIPAEKQKPDVNPFAADPANPIPPLVACYLPVEALQEALKTDDRLQQIAFYEVESAETVVEKDEPLQIPEFKSSQVSRIKKKEITINDICIACCCDHNSAADTINGQKIFHPLFEGLLCKQCRETIKTTMYAPGADNKNSFCAICGQVGKLAVCEGVKCHRVFCFVCINLFVGPEAETEILNAKSWECFLCKEYNFPSESLLKPRSNWRELVKNMFDPLLFYLQREITTTNKTPLRILSLCDGLSAVKNALNKLNLNISAYYAVEQDKDAISVVKHNHPDSIIFLDNIESLTPEKIATIAPIDLIIGGTPCVDIPTSSYNRKGLFDLKLGGQHFLLFNHILDLIRHFNKGRHVFFLFDSVASLPNTNRDIISDLLMCKPVTLSAKNVSTPSRSRYLWSNIPGINRPLHSDIHDNYLKLSDLIAYRKTHHDLLSAGKGKDEIPAELDDPVALEKLLGFSEGYSDVANLTVTKRISVLSKTWSVPIVSHLLWALVDFFETK